VDRDALPWLHIYAQYQWHDEATIEGTRRALVNLRDAIDRALSERRDAESEAFAADGEGYRVKVKIRSYEFLSKVPLPYTADHAASPQPEPMSDRTTSSTDG
jgi:hypothetical protein